MDFVGEALASISHVAQVTITSRTAHSLCAYRCSYSDGSPISNGGAAAAGSVLKPCAANIGTQITVEDLFYNVATRRKALKNTSEEQHRILDTMNRYAVHNAGKAFVCKKSGTTVPELNTHLGESKLDVIRQVYGALVARELLDIKMELTPCRCTMTGLVTNANYNTKKAVSVFFVNGSLVHLLKYTHNS